MITRSAHINHHEGRTLDGNAFLFDHPSRVTDDGRNWYQEEFARSCANKSIADRDRYALGILHPWTPGAKTSPIPIGSVRFNPSDEALAFEAVISRTVAGDEALELINDGALSDVSISARPIRDSRRGQVLRREEIALRELSLCPPGMGQHHGAQVLTVRSELITPNPVNANRLRLLILPK